MTDWQPGDRFKLECEGKVNRRGANWIDVDLGSPMGQVSFGFPDWFVVHATKIKRPFQFGDRVELNRDEYWIVLEEINPEHVRVWRKNTPTIHVCRRDVLTLIKAAEAT